MDFLFPYLRGVTTIREEILERIRREQEAEDALLREVMTTEAKRIIWRNQCKPEPLKSKPEPKIVEQELSELDIMLTALEIKTGIRKGEVEIEPIKSCRKCAFCSSVRVLNTTWYVRCTNYARANNRTGWLWKIAELNLSCWRES